MQDTLACSVKQQVTPRFTLEIRPVGGRCLLMGGEGLMPFDQESMGEQQLKGFEEPVRVYRVRLKQGETIPEAELFNPPRRSSTKRNLVFGISAIGLIAAVGIILWLQPWINRDNQVTTIVAKDVEPDKPSIAVLPFDNLSGDQEQRYFADGLADDLITDL